MADYNSMMSSLGIVPGLDMGTPVIRPPAEVAAALSQQASMNLQQAQAQLPTMVGSSANFTFGAQYRQQFQAAQSSQMMNPYAANAMAGGGMSLPSPLQMTPASTGVFRAPTPPVSYAPIPQMATMQPMGFGPQLPQPMFQTAWDMEMRQRDLRSDQLYSYAAQAPGMMGQGAGYGIGAFAGAALGARFGGAGRFAGAAMGAGLSHFSGLASGLGGLGNMMMGPSNNAHMMGAAIQRSSQDWVVSGPQLHGLGSGFSRDASLQLARGVQGLAGSSSFQDQTGGMFNSQDLMGILQNSGRAGLMDTAQSVDGVKANLRQVSLTIKKFMELTNDPDVNSVIREMGQLRQFGLSLGEMETAASNMRTFSRAAGTTIDGIKQMGGMPGAAVYQNIGLTAGGGFQYGMFSAAAARQAVASGTYDPRQLALMGGVQGITQRNIQAQAAFMSMPMMGAAMGSFGGGGWGLDYGSMANQLLGGGGAAGLVTGAAGNMGRAAQAGGIGALALYPLQQRRVQADAANAMSPELQTAMRYRMAMDTGRGMGLQGAGAFALGARTLYGDDVAGQMLTEASNPEYWKALQRNQRSQQRQIAMEQSQAIKDAAPGVWGSVVNSLTPGASAMDSISDLGGGFSAPGRALGKAWGGITDYIADTNALSSGQIRREVTEAAAMSGGTVAAQQAKLRAMGGIGAVRGRGRGHGMNWGRLARAWQSENGAWGEGAQTAAAWGGDVAAGLGTFVLPGVGIAAGGAAMGGLSMSSLMESAQGGAFALTATPGQVEGLLSRANARDMAGMRMFQGAKNRPLSGAAASAAYQEIETKFGLKPGQGYAAIVQAGNKLNKVASHRDGWFDSTTESVGPRDAKAVAISAIAKMSQRNKGQPALSVAAAKAEFEKLSPDAQNTLIETVVGSAMKTADPTQANVLMLSEGRFSANAMGDSWDSTKSKLDNLTSLQRQSEMSLGVRGDWGAHDSLYQKWGWGEALGTASDRAGADEFRKFVSESPTSRVLAAALLNSNEGTAPGIQAALEQQLGREGVAPGDISGRISSLQQGLELTPSLSGRFANLGGGRLSGSQIAEGVRGYSANLFTQQYVGKQAAYLRGAGKAIGSTALSGATSLTDISPTDLEALQGIPMYKEFAKSVARAQQGGSIADAQANVLAGSPDTMLVDQESLTTASGPAAKNSKMAAQALAAAAADFNKVFQNFNAESAENFKTGAEKLYEAMQLHQNTSGGFVDKVKKVPGR